METLNAIVKRRSVRSFSTESVSRDLIKEIIEVCKYYPSWKNSQTSRFYVVDDKDTILKIADEGTFGKGHNEKIISNCPALLVLVTKRGLSGVHGDNNISKNHNWEVFDSGIAAQTFSLTAFEKGLGSVILGIFKDDVIANICNIKDDEFVSALIPFGFPENTISKDGVRKPLEEILKFI